MPSPKKCFGVDIPELNLHGKLLTLHELPSKENIYPGVLALSPDAPEERIKDLYLSKAHSDVEVSLQRSGEVFQVHKLILAMTSPVFERMLIDNADMLILDDNPDALKWILMHAYFSYCELPPKVSDIIILHETLHRYAMNEMAMKCILMLRNLVRVETVDEIYTVSLKFQQKMLQIRCIEEIRKNGKQILSLASKGKISSDLLFRILESESLESSEIDVFKALVSWSKIKVKDVKNEEGSDLKSFLKPYLYEVDFLSMRQEEILGEVSKENVFTIEEIASIILANKNISEHKPDEEDSTECDLIVPSSYPSYLRAYRKERRLNHPDDNGRTCQIFMYLKCDHKGKWLSCGHYPILTLQVSEEMFITRIIARPDCFVGENFIEILDHGMLIGTSTVNGPPWDFNYPIRIKKNSPHVITLNGKGKICHHEFKMFSINNSNIELCGNCILCDVTIKYII